MTISKVVLYSRSGCHLCDDAQRLLERYGLSIKVVDIDQDPKLRERYHRTIPVVEIDGQVRFRGSVDELLLLRLLRSGK